MVTVNGQLKCGVSHHLTSWDKAEAVNMSECTVRVSVCADNRRNIFWSEPTEIKLYLSLRFNLK